MRFDFIKHNELCVIKTKIKITIITAEKARIVTIIKKKVLILHAKVDNFNLIEHNNGNKSVM